MFKNGGEVSHKTGDEAALKMQISVEICLIKFREIGFHMC